MNPKTKTSKLPIAPPINLETEAPADKPHPKDKPDGALWRKLLAGFLGLVTFWVVILTMLSLWAGQTITSTSRVTSVVGPLATKPAIQTFVDQKLAQQILDNATTKDLEKQFLTPGQIHHLSTAQAKQALKPKLEAAIGQVSASPAFATLWTQTVSSAHSQALAAAKGSTSTATINIRPQLNSLIILLQKTKLGGLVKAGTLNKDAGNIKLKDDQLKNLRNAYSGLVNIPIVLGATAIVLASLTIFTANKRWSAARNLSLAIAAAMGLLWSIIDGLSKVKKLGTLDPQEQAALQAAFSGIFGGLKHLAMVIGLTGLVVGVGIVALPRLRHRFSNARKR